MIIDRDQQKPAPESKVSMTSASLAIAAPANQVMSKKTLPLTSESLAGAPDESNVAMTSASLAVAATANQVMPEKTLPLDDRKNDAKQYALVTQAPTARPMLENSNKKSANEVALDPAQQVSVLALQGRKMMLRW